MAIKTVFKLATAFAIASMTFVACNKHETEIPQNEEDFYYTFSITNPETRSILASDENGKYGSWETGDQLGTGVNEANPGYSAITPGTPVTFKIYKQGGLKENDAIYAYYPYNPSTESINAVALEIPVSQGQNGSVFDFDAMPMAAERFIVPADLESTTSQTNVVGQISFVNLGSVVDFQVYSTNVDYADETILSVKFQANKAIAGDFEKDITAIDFSDESTLAISGYSENDVTTIITEAPEFGATRAAAAHVYMVIAPSTDVTGSVIVTTNKAKYTYSLSAAQTFKRAGLKSFGLNLGTCQNRVEETIVIPVTASYKMDDYYVANEKVNPLVLDEVVTLSTTTTGNSGKFYGNAPNREWRLYQTDKAFVTVTLADGYELRGVQFNYGVSNSGTLLNAPSGEFIEVTGSSVTYTVGNTGTATNGQVRLISVTVKYISSSSKETVPAPTNVTAEADGKDINVEWTDADHSHIAYYLVTCTGQGDQQVEPGTEFAIFEDLSDGYYVVTVTAIPDNLDNYNRSTTWTNEDSPIVIGTPFEPVFFTFSRSNSSDNLTSGYELTVENGKLDAAYIQDKNSTTGLDLLFTKENESALFSSSPNSISLTVKVGGGTAKNPLDNNVLAYLVDANGDNLSSTQTIVTNKVETNNGKEYTVSIPNVSSAYGLRISHQKESGYNVRIYSVSFTAN